MGTSGKCWPGSPLTSLRSPSVPPRHRDWADLIQRVERLRDFNLEVLDLEDRCLLPRARAIAEADSRLGP
jgi:hypothetical protein